MKKKEQIQENAEQLTQNTGQASKSSWVTFQSSNQIYRPIYMGYDQNRQKLKTVSFKHNGKWFILKNPQIEIVFNETINKFEFSLKVEEVSMKQD